jgi:hypothetical protein
MSLEPRASGAAELALRIIARPGAWFSFLVPEVKTREVVRNISREVETASGKVASLIDASAGALALIRQARDVDGGALILSGFERLSDEEWRHIDLLRSQLTRDEPVVLVLSMHAFERLMRCAPNLASTLGGAVFGLDEEADYFTQEENEEQLRVLREWSGLSDAEMIARVERGAIRLEPRHAQWLVLLGRGDLLDRGR